MKTKPKILIIDDEEIILNFLAEELNFAGFETYTATSGKKAEPLIQAIQFEVVITDFRMNDGDGLYVLGLVEKLPKSPFVYFISADGKFFESRDKKSIIKEYFQKPFKVDQIIDRIKNDLKI